MSGEYTEYIERAYAFLNGQSGPVSYNEARAFTEAAHRHAQYHEMPLREAVLLAYLLAKPPVALVDDRIRGGDDRIRTGE